MKMPSSQKQCPECKQLAELGAQVCTHCGHRFRTQFAVPETTVMVSNAERCPSCSSLIPPQAAFCPVCGSSVRASGTLDTMSAFKQISLHMGEVYDEEFKLSVQIAVPRSNDAAVMITVDSLNGINFATLQLDLNRFSELKHLILQTDQAITQMRQRGRVR